MFTNQLNTAKIVDQLKKAGVYNPKINIIGLEGLQFWRGKFTLTDDRPNVYNDSVIVIAEVNNKPEVVDAYLATTEPGHYYTENPMNPRGAARIALGSYKDCYEIGTHGSNPKFQHTALRQCGPMTVCRDLNEDYKRTGDRKETGIFYTNLHGAPWGNSIQDINRDSAGCVVIYYYSELQNLLKLCRASGLSKFSFSLFDGAGALPGSSKPLL